MELIYKTNLNEKEFKYKIYKKNSPLDIIWIHWD